MSEEKTKRKSGYAYLRAKLNKVEADLEDYKFKYAQALSDLKDAQDQVKKTKYEIDQIVDLYKLTVKRLGPIRRFIFGY